MAPMVGGSSVREHQARDAALSRAPDPAAGGDPGGEAREAILGMLPEGWSPDGRRLLDFDCDGGWALRHFVPEAETAEVWGCEPDAAALAAIERTLCPPFHAIGRQASPPLALPDGSFQLAWALSAFTRLADDWAEWLLEIHRLLSDRGLLVVALGTPEAYGELTGAAWDESLIGMTIVSSLDGARWAVFHSEWWLRAHWGRAFEVLAMERLKAGPWLLLRKRPLSISAAELRAPDPGEERELVAAGANSELLRAQLETLRSRMEARLRSELDSQREEFHRELMRKSFEATNVEWGLGGPQSPAALIAAEYEASLSWRLTKPLRAVGKLLRRVR
jgi:SAM-dependent methyltransferase